jgi:hypothetical protein
MLYVRFPLSPRNVEDLLHERGIEVSHEAVRFWWHRFGTMFAGEIRRRRIHGMRSTQWRWHLDEMLASVHASVSNHFTSERSFYSPPSRPDAPPLSPSGAVSARRKGQLSCPSFSWTCHGIVPLL